MSDKVSGGQLLHAYKLGFIHPTTGEHMVFAAKPEERLINWYKKLGGEDAGIFDRLTDE